MLKIKNTQIFGLERALIAAGNPMIVGEIDTLKVPNQDDINRAIKLCNQPNGSGHMNFLSGIQVVFDVIYPQYWSMEFQRYHFAQIVSSTSKMHRLVANANSDAFDNSFNQYVDGEAVDRVRNYVERYNEAKGEQKFYYFMKALSNLPMGYEMGLTITTNYLQLRTIYSQRKNHKLKEDWGPFCTWVESLPMAKEFLIN